MRKITHILPVAAILFFVAALGTSSVKAEENPNNSGFTLGLFGQGTWSDIDFTEILIAPPYTSESADGNIDGFGYGASLGYDLYLNPVWMIGLDFDYSQGNWKESYDLRPDLDMVGFYEIDWAVTIRGRVGYKIKPKLLAYLTGGYAMAHVTHGLAAITPQATYKADGWVLGLGGEYEMGPVTLFGEYLHTDYKTGGIPVLHAERHVIDLDSDTIRFGVKFKFPGNM